MDKPFENSNSFQVIILPAKKLVELNLHDLWRYRELLFFLTWRDVKVRYKQTILGAAWALLQPLLSMVIFTLIFGIFAKLPSQGIPYPLFTLSALVPWQLFSFALSMSATSLVADQNLLTKVYFPRLIIPISSVLAGFLDFLIAFVFLVGLMIAYGIPLTWRIALVPLLAIFVLFTAISVGLWLSALNVKYRDVRYTLPFLTLIWMYVTPVAYSSTIVPERWRILYSLNPMTGVVEGFRWAFFGASNGSGLMVVVSIIVVGFLLLGGLVYFKRMEDHFADLV